MLEGWLAEFLGHLLGDFIEDIDEKQLRIAVWEGNVDLRNLYIRSDALSRLGIPLRVKRGRIGSLHLSVPWSNIKGEPTKVVIKDVFILLEAPQQFEPTGYERRRHAAKLSAAERALRPIKAKLAARSDDKDDWKSSLFQTIVDNLQVKIHNVHLRLEDSTLLQASRLPTDTHVAAGLFFHSCQVYTTDSKGNATTTKSSGLVHKSVVVQGFALYWDTHTRGVPCGAPMQFDQENHSSFSNQMHQEMRLLQIGSLQPSEHHYLCHPMSAVGRTVHSRYLLPDMPANTPRRKLEVQVCHMTQLREEAAVLLELSEAQLWGMCALADRCLWLLRAEKNRWLRPKPYMQRPTEGRTACRLWWNYVGRYLIQEARRRKVQFSAAGLAQRRLDRCRYAQLFQQVLEMPWADKPTEDVLVEWAALRARLSVDDIVFFEALSIRVAQHKQLQYDQILESQSVWDRIFSSRVPLMGELSLKEEAEARQLFREDVVQAFGRPVQLECCVSATSLVIVVRDHWRQRIAELASHSLKLEYCLLSEHFELRYFCGAVEAVDHCTHSPTSPAMMSSLQCTPAQHLEFMEGVAAHSARLEASGCRTQANALRAAQERVHAEQRGWFVEYTSSQGSKGQPRVLWYSTDALQLVLSAPCIERLSGLMHQLAELQLEQLQGEAIRSKIHDADASVPPEHLRAPGLCVTVCLRVPVLIMPVSMTHPNRGALVMNAGTAICTTTAACESNREEIYTLSVQDVCFYSQSSLDSASRTPLCPRPFSLSASGTGSHVQVEVHGDVEVVLSGEDYSSLTGVVMSLQRIFYSGQQPRRPLEGNDEPQGLRRSQRGASCAPFDSSSWWFACDVVTQGVRISLEDDSIKFCASVVGLRSELKLLAFASIARVTVESVMLSDLKYPDAPPLLSLLGSDEADPCLEYVVETHSRREIGCESSVSVQRMAVEYNHRGLAALLKFLTPVEASNAEDAIDLAQLDTDRVLAEARQRGDSVTRTVDAVDKMLEQLEQLEKEATGTALAADESCDTLFSDPSISSVASKLSEASQLGQADQQSPCTKWTLRVRQFQLAMNNTSAHDHLCFTRLASACWNDVRVTSVLLRRGMWITGALRTLNVQSHHTGLPKAVLDGSGPEDWLSFQFGRNVCSELRRVCPEAQLLASHRYGCLSRVSVGDTSATVDKDFVTSVVEYMHEVPIRHSPRERPLFRDPSIEMIASPWNENVLNQDLSVQVSLMRTSMVIGDRGEQHMCIVTPRTRLRAELRGNLELEISFPVEEDTGSIEATIDPDVLFQWASLLRTDSQNTVEPGRPVALKIAGLPLSCIRFNNRGRCVGEFSFAALDIEQASYLSESKLGFRAREAQLCWQHTEMRLGTTMCVFVNNCAEGGVTRMLPTLEVEADFEMTTETQDVSVVVDGDTQIRLEPAHLDELCEFFDRVGAACSTVPERVTDTSASATFMGNILTQHGSLTLLLSPHHAAPLTQLALWIENGIDVQYESSPAGQLRIQFTPQPGATRVAMLPSSVGLHSVGVLEEALLELRTLPEQPTVLTYTEENDGCCSCITAELGQPSVRWVPTHVASLMSLVNTLSARSAEKNPAPSGVDVTLSYDLVARDVSLEFSEDTVGAFNALGLQTSSAVLSGSFTELIAAEGILERKIVSEITLEQMLLSCDSVKLCRSDALHLTYQEIPRREAQRAVGGPVPATTVALWSDGVAEVWYDHVMFMSTVDFFVGMSLVLEPAGFFAGTELAGLTEAEFQAHGSIESVRSQIEDLSLSEFDTAVNTVRAALCRNNSAAASSGKWLQEVYKRRIRAVASNLGPSNGALYEATPEQAFELCKDQSVATTICTSTLLAACAIQIQLDTSSLLFQVRHDGADVLGMSLSSCHLCSTITPEELNLALELELAASCPVGALRLLGTGPSRLVYSESLSRCSDALGWRTRNTELNVSLENASSFCVAAMPGTSKLVSEMVQEVSAFNVARMIRRGELAPEKESIDMLLPSAFGLHCASDSVGLELGCVLQWARAPHFRVTPTAIDADVPRGSANIVVNTTGLLPTFGVLNISGAELPLEQFSKDQLKLDQVGPAVRRWMGVSRWPVVWGRTLRLLLAFDFGVAIPAAMVYTASEWSSGSSSRALVAAMHSVGVLAVPGLTARRTGVWSAMLPHAAEISLYVLAMNTLHTVQRIPWHWRNLGASILSVLQVVHVVSRCRQPEIRYPHLLKHEAPTTEPTKPSQVTRNLALCVMLISTTFAFLRTRKLR